MGDHGAAADVVVGDPLPIAEPPARAPALVNVEAGLQQPVRLEIDQNPAAAAPTRVAGARRELLPASGLVTSAPLPVETGLGIVVPVQADVDAKLHEAVSVGHETSADNFMFGSHVLIETPKIGSIIFVLGHEPGAPPADQTWPHVPAIVTRVRGHLDQAVLHVIDATVIPPGAMSFSKQAIEHGMLPGNWCWPEELDAVTRLRELDALRLED